MTVVSKNVTGRLTSESRTALLRCLEKVFSKRASRGNSQASRADKRMVIIASRTNSVGDMSSVSA